MTIDQHLDHINHHALRVGAKIERAAICAYLRALGRTAEAAALECDAHDSERAFREWSEPLIDIDLPASGEADAQTKSKANTATQQEPR